LTTTFGVQHSDSQTPVVRLRAFQVVAGTLSSAGLFYGGYTLLLRGIEAKGSLDLNSALLSGKITAESAGLAMIFAGVIVFLAPLMFRAQIPGKDSARPQVFWGLFRLGCVGH
jgi:hypothetical protein